VVGGSGFEQAHGYRFIGSFGHRTMEKLSVVPGQLSVARDTRRSRALTGCGTTRRHCPIPRGDVLNNRGCCPWLLPCALAGHENPKRFSAACKPTDD
jgi:hypothetical protein